MAREIFRSSHNSVIGGVCGGIGEYFDLDPVLIRVIWLFAVFSGVGILAYLVCWVLIPKNPNQIGHKRNSQYENGYYDEHYHQHSKERREKIKLLFGAGLIIVGGFSLMKRFMPGFDFNLIWPMILILGGFYLIYREKGKYDKK